MLAIIIDDGLFDRHPCIAIYMFFLKKIFIFATGSACYNHARVDQSAKTTISYEKKQIGVQKHVLRNEGKMQGVFLYIRRLPQMTLLKPHFANTVN